MLLIITWTSLWRRRRWRMPLIRYFHPVSFSRIRLLLNRSRSWRLISSIRRARRRRRLPGKSVLDRRRSLCRETDILEVCRGLRRRRRSLLVSLIPLWALVPSCRIDQDHLLGIKPSQLKNLNVSELCHLSYRQACQIQFKINNKTNHKCRIPELCRKVRNQGNRSS